MIIELTELEVALISHCLLWYGSLYECNDKNYQTNMRKISEGLDARLINEVYKQTGDRLKHICCFNEMHEEILSESVGVK